MVQGKAKWFKEKRGFISSQSPMLSTKLYALPEAATPYMKLIVTVPPLSPDVIDLRNKNAENFISGAKHTESRYQAKTIWESWCTQTCSTMPPPLCTLNLRSHRLGVSPPASNSQTSIPPRRRCIPPTPTLVLLGDAATRAAG
ncbi:hypothetical protein CMEL01_04977 [Colletotrichum melonis]|uniref:Uncharacterized protein n=1 Tax=Colletotrichum melonis TaxID=1209925 RepID=A0AAI9U7Q6_9PEZI|nr:hypothetical protein CMEL01_04977 [Colletotrichum melonis]